MGQDGIPMSVAVLFVGILLGSIALVGLLIAVVFNV